MQSLDILFPGTDRVSIEDLLAKLSELGETFDETEAAYARMTLEEFDSNDDGHIDKSGKVSLSLSLSLSPVTKIHTWTQREISNGLLWNKVLVTDWFRYHNPNLLH